MSTQKFDEFYLRFYDKSNDLERCKARLFPSSENLKVIDEDVTSNIFMAGLVGIKEYCDAFFQEIDIKIKSNAKVHAYSQIDFQNQLVGGKNDVPDGMLVITEGNTNPIITWIALLEFKTKDVLRKEQIERYTKIAKDPKHNFDAIITISNDFVSNPKQNPLGFRNTSKLTYFHFSWKRIETILEYVIQKGINDDDQIYLAKQLLLYMNDHKYIMHFNQMNKDWSEQSKKIITTKKFSKTKHKDLLYSISIDWLQEEQDLGLKIKADCYKDISVKMTSEESKKSENRQKVIINKILEDKILQTIYKVTPDKTKGKPFYFTNKKNIEVNNKILLIPKIQEISFEVLFNGWTQKTIKKQVEYVIRSILNKKIGMMNEIVINIFTKDSRKEVSSKTLDQYERDIKRDILNGFKGINPKSEIKKIEFKSTFDLNKDFFSRKGFINKIETNFRNLFSQILEPFII